MSRTSGLGVEAGPGRGTSHPAPRGGPPSDLPPSRPREPEPGAARATGGAGPAMRDAPKRLLDIGLSLTGLVLSAPLWVVLAAAIRLEDGGPIFFGQERVGRYGTLFRSWKFRSMRAADEERPHGAPRQATRDDPRITKVGRLMRRTALDELPQLWNILRGDMSFVGPRALLRREEQVQGGGSVDLRELPGFEERHSVRPGLTGLAQVRAARDIPLRAKLRYDLLYVRTRTFWLDVRLIAESVWISLRGAWPKVGRQGEEGEGRGRGEGKPGR